MQEKVFQSTMPGVTYLWEMDQSRLNELLPYRVEASKLDFVEIAERANQSYFSAFQPGYEGAQAGRLAVDPILRYHQLLEALKALPNVEFVTAAELIDRTPKGDELLIQIRHDVDGDLMAALAQAEVEARLGIKTTNYVLHTAPYYGGWNEERRVFERHEASLPVYRHIQALGHEIGLHTDGLSLYQTHKTDGAQAIREELAWLRAAGLRITGTVSHNSISTYGACNYAIFKGRPVGRKFDQPAGPLGVSINGNWAPLQVLDEAELNLTYEGNELFWQERMPLEYFCLMSQNSWYHITWQAGDALPMLTSAARADEWMTQERVVDYVAELERPAAVLLSVHCMHYGMRPGPNATPVLPATRIPPVWHKSPLGWWTIKPGLLTAEAAGHSDAPEYQSFVVANEHGMLDMLAANDVPGTPAILFLGRDNVHGSTVCVNSKISQALVRLAKNKHGYDLHATSLAGPSVNATILAAWCEAFVAVTGYVLDTVILSVGVDDVVLCDPKSFGDLWRLNSESAAILNPDVFDDRSLQAVSRTSPPSDPIPDRQAYALGSIASILVDYPQPAGLAAWSVTDKRLAGAIGFLKSRAKHIVLLLEDCGEKAGLWNQNTGLTERHRLARRADALFNPIASQLGVAFVNPYHEFNSYKGYAKTHWASNNEWSVHGHALASGALLKYIDTVGDNWMMPLREGRRQLKEAYKAGNLSTHFSDFSRMVETLQTQGRFDFKPMRDFGDPSPSQQVRIYLRFGVYSDPIGAIELADYLKARGVAATFFLLHTANFYGSFAAGQFEHSATIEQVVRRLAGGGHEIGLQIDPLYIYQTVGVDGTAAVLAEIAWLRSKGIDVKGVTANGSAAAYGAENYEIFKGYAAGDRTSVERGGKSNPLQTVALTDAGLTYIADLPSPHWAQGTPAISDRGTTGLHGSDVDGRSNFHDIQQDLTVSLAKRGCWNVSDHRAGGVIEMSTQLLADRLLALPAGARVILIAHAESLEGNAPR